MSYTIRLKKLFKDEFLNILHTFEKTTNLYTVNHKILFMNKILLIIEFLHMVYLDTCFNTN